MINNDQRENGRLGHAQFSCATENSIVKGVRLD
jgi:hypothetical protein